jgi:hypothetical protein
MWHGMKIKKIVKIRCDICHSNIAKWEYLPRGYSYYCDDCVPRGCSCNVDENGIEDKDNKGRLLPCCEYDYLYNGWTANYLLNKGSKYPKWINIYESKYVKSNKRSLSKARFIYY